MHIPLIGKEKIFNKNTAIIALLVVLVFVAGVAVCNFIGRGEFREDSSRYDRFEKRGRDGWGARGYGEGDRVRRESEQTITPPPETLPFPSQEVPVVQ